MMNSHPDFIPICVIAFCAGAALAALVRHILECRSRNEVRAEADKRVALAKKEIELAALEERTRAEAASREREDDLRRRLLEVERREQDSVRAMEEIEAGAARARADAGEAARLRRELTEELHRQRAAALKIARMAPDEARRVAIELAKGECEAEIAAELRKITARREEEVREEARTVLVGAMQRLASEVTQSANATVIAIPNEEMKGRIIGREGRNIRAFEQITGTTLLVDDTPESILISSFNPVQREVARIALQRLITDGRIHPASIEDFVEQAREEVLGDVRGHGRAAVEELGLPPLPEDLTEALGKLYFHYSLNQNTLAHSIEVARLAGLIAAEFGLDVALARRAGLLHDIGKALDADFEGSHAAAGAAYLRRCDEDPRVVNAVAAHHEEVPPASIYAPIVMLADKVSAARPGARMPSLAATVDRMRGLEEIARSFRGVSEAYAVRAGRELRVSIAADILDDDQARETARLIRRSIEERQQFAGTIRITVIRERRFDEVAR